MYIYLCRYKRIHPYIRIYICVDTDVSFLERLLAGQTFFARSFVPGCYIVLRWEISGYLGDLGSQSPAGFWFRTSQEFWALRGGAVKW